MTYRLLTNTWKDAQHRSLLEKSKSKPQWAITSQWSEWPSWKSLQTRNAGEGVEKRERSCAVGGNVNWYSHYRRQYAAAAAKSLQSCPTLCDPIRRQPTRLHHPWDSPGTNTGVGCHCLLQWMKVKMKVKSVSHVRLFTTPWTAAYQAPPSTGFSRQECWSGVPLPSPNFRVRYTQSMLFLSLTIRQSCTCLS